ncbi:coiled-coil domain-containing protein 115 isoform X2 [Columba livia]|uniref:coiled-coil domain-containing protein 115 isoform X2 n=1 Tax=Columba livia TaxID=8932 RepID=UPI0031BAFA07
MAAEPASLHRPAGPQPSPASRPAASGDWRRSGGGGCDWRRRRRGVRPRRGPVATAMEGSPGLDMELDEALLELLGALEALEKKRGELEGLMREGWLSLSQSRYSLGCHRVSSLQYGATIVPRVTVLPRQDPGGHWDFLEVTGTRDPQQPLGGDDGLRQRRGDPISGKGTPTSPPRDPHDPLRWFGVLVPPSLRRAQENFSRGVAVAVELAGLQGAMTAATNRYRLLMGMKRKRGDIGDIGDIETTGDIETIGDSEAVGDIETIGDTEAVGDIETTGDIETIGDIEAVGDNETKGDTGSSGDTETLGDIETVGDMGTLGDTETLGDIETMGDMGSSGDTRTLGDMGPPGDNETLGDMGTVGDTGTSGDIETLGDIETMGDIETTGDTEAVGDIETTGDIETIGDIEAVGDNETKGDTGSSGDTRG